MREGEVTYVAAAHLRLKKKKWSLVDKSARKPRKIKKIYKQIGQFICYSFFFCFVFKNKNS